MTIVAKTACQISPKGSLDVYGGYKHLEPHGARCAVVRLVTGEDKTSVRADSSASRGHADEIITKSRLLFPPKTEIAVDDLVELLGIKLKVTDIQIRIAVSGVLDHLQVELEHWPLS